MKRRERLRLTNKSLTAALTAICSAVVAVIAVEIAVRFGTHYPTPAAVRDRTLEYGPSLFARHVFPARALHAWNEDEQNPVGYDINERGYRGRSFSVPKPAGVVRIVFYGGSATFDMNLPEGRDWPHRVEALLRESGHPEVDVVNAGIPGHASWDSFGRLFSEGHTFAPDYVVSVNGWNDFRYFRSDGPLLREFQPLCHSSRNYDLRLNYHNPIDRVLSEHSQLYLRFRRVFVDWWLGVGPLGVPPAGSGPYHNAVTDAAVRQYYLNQAMFVDLANQIGAVPLLIAEPRLTTGSNTVSQKARIAPYLDYVKLDHDTLVGAYDRLEGALRKIAADKRVALIDAGGAINGRDDFFTDVVHLTPAGSETFAQLIASRLRHLLDAGAAARSAAREGA